MKKLYLVFLAAALVLANSCSIEEVTPEEPGLIEIEASTVQTKVSCNPENGAFSWSAGDQIGVNVNGTLTALTIKSGVGQKTAKFAAAATGTVGNYAVYPYSANNNISGNTVTIDLPATGTLDLDASVSNNAAMWAKVEGESAQFKHLGGVLAISLNDLSTDSDVTLEITADQRLSGAFTADLTATEPKIATEATAGKVERIGGGLPNGVCFIPVATGTYTNLKVIVDGTVKRTYSKVVVNRCDYVMLDDKTQKPANPGANFANATLKVIPHYGADQRWGTFDGQNVVLSGSGIMKYISLADVMAGKTEMKDMSRQGFAGGRLSNCCAQSANGHIYACNIAQHSTTLPADDELKIYHYESADAVPTLIWHQKVADLTKVDGARFGDAMSMDLDENGNGYIFFQKNGQSVETIVIRLTVKNYTTISNPVELKHSVVGNYKTAWTWDTITKVEESGQYIHSGAACLGKFMDKDLVTSLNLAYKPELVEFASIRIINFNGKRYLFGIKTGKGNGVDAVASVYDISEGATPEEGVTKFFAKSDRNPLFTHKVGGNHGGLAFVCADYYIEKKGGYDNKLYLFATAKEEGAIVLEVPTN